MHGSDSQSGSNGKGRVPLHRPWFAPGEFERINEIHKRAVRLFSDSGEVLPYLDCVGMATAEVDAELAEQKKTPAPGAGGDEGQADESLAAGRLEQRVGSKAS